VGIPLNINFLTIWDFWLLKLRKFHVQGTKLLEVKKLTFASHQTRSGDHSRKAKIKKKLPFLTASGIDQRKRHITESEILT